MSGGFVWPVCDLGLTFVVDSSFKYHENRTGRRRVPRPQTRARRRRTGPAHRPPRRPPAASPQSAPPHPRTLGTTCPGELSALTPAGARGGACRFRFETMSFQSTRPRRYTSIAEFTDYTHSNSLEPAGCSLRACSLSSHAHAHAARTRRRQRQRPVSRGRVRPAWLRSEKQPRQRVLRVRGLREQERSLLQGF